MGTLLANTVHTTISYGICHGIPLGILRYFSKNLSIFNHSCTRIDSRELNAGATTATTTFTPSPNTEGPDGNSNLHPKNTQQTTALPPLQCHVSGTSTCRQKISQPIAPLLSEQSQRQIFQIFPPDDNQSNILAGPPVYFHHLCAAQQRVIYF